MTEPISTAATIWHDPRVRKSSGGRERAGLEFWQGHKVDHSIMQTKRNQGSISRGVPGRCFFKQKTPRLLKLTLGAPDPSWKTKIASCAEWLRLARFRVGFRSFRSGQQRKRSSQGPAPCDNLLMLPAASAFSIGFPLWKRSERLLGRRGRGRLCLVSAGTKKGQATARSISKKRRSLRKLQSKSARVFAQAFFIPYWFSFLRKPTKSKSFFHWFYLFWGSSASDCWRGDEASQARAQAPHSAKCADPPRAPKAEPKRSPLAKLRSSKRRLCVAID